MKKNTRLLAAAAALVVLLSVALVVVLLLPSDTNKITVTDNNEILLFDKSGLLPESITITNESGTYELLAYEYTTQVENSLNSMENIIAVPHSDVSTTQTVVERVYTMQEYPERTLDKNMTDDLAVQCQQLTARELIDKSGQKYADYGLGQPRSTVNIRYSDSVMLTLYIGNEAPDHQGVYVRIEGDRNVYLVQVSQVEAFLWDKLQLFDKHLTGTMEDVQSLCISGSHYPEAIVLTANTVSAYPVAYGMTSPVRLACDNAKTDRVTNSACLLQAIWVTAVNVNEDGLSSYGLAQPYERLDMEGKDGNSIHLVASEKDSDGKIYLMKVGDDTVYQTYAAENAWYGVAVEDFFPDALLKVQADEIRSLQLTAEEHQTDYRLTKEKSVNDNYYETANLTLTANGQTVPYANYSIFVDNLCRMKRQSTSTDDLTEAQEVLKAVFTYFGEDSPTDTLCLYRLPSGKTVAVLNDQVSSYVNSDYADQVIQQLPNITKDVRLPVLNEDGSVSAADD